MRSYKQRFPIVSLLVLLMALSGLSACGGSDSGTTDTGSSLSYKGHQTVADANNLVAAYPAVRGTRLDDCQTCHRAGQIVSDGETNVLNPCSFCHAYAIDHSSDEGAPTSYQATLNLYGYDYKTHGRSEAALKDIAGLDSDSDGHANADEIAALRYPGDPQSYPGKQVAPIITLTYEQITGMTHTSEFLLMNATKQTTDEYALYEGVKIKDLLTSAGVDLSGATGVTLFAADGFTTSYAMSDLDSAMPAETFYAGLEQGGTLLGANGFVSYPDDSLWPSGLLDQGTISPAPWVLLAFLHNGTALEDGYLDTTSGQIGGEGPFRGVIPQKTPGRPDRGRSVAPVNDGWDYLADADHNAGKCPKVTVAIRVDPMPAGFEEFDWQNGGWAMVAKKTLIIYGAGVSGR